MSEIKENPKIPPCDSGVFLEASDAPLVTLVVGETQLSVHKSVLVARSPVFAAMLTHDTVEASSSRIAIADVEPKVVQQLVVFMYKDSAPQLCSMAPQLLVAADKYCMPELKSQCELQLVLGLSVENVVASALLALRHSCPRLKEAARCFLQGNLAKVMVTEGWAEAVQNHPEEFVELSRLLAATRNTCQEEMNRKLLEAVENNRLKEVQELLGKGVYVGARDMSWRTALHYAVDTDTVKCLLEAGALVNARDKWHRTPLHAAIQRRDLYLARQLVEASSKVNAADVYGDTPLHLAAQWGEYDMIKSLLKMDADKEARNNLQQTPLHVAEQFKNGHLVSMLSVSDSAKMSEVNENAKTLVCDFGALLETRDAAPVSLVAGETQLVAHRSVLMARSPVFAEILNDNTEEASSSRIAIADVEPKVLQQLVLFMYKDSAPQLCSMAPQLLVAADKYCVPELKSQCELQLLVDLSVENVVASALLALRHSCPRLKEAAQCFLQDNLTKVMDTEGWAEAVRNHPEEFVELSRVLAATRSASQEQLDRELLQKAGQGYSLSNLLASGAYVGARDAGGRTALHCVASGSGDMKCLLEAGANVEAWDMCGRTALHYAAASGSKGKTQLLLKAGARVDVRDRWLQTPLHLAVQKNSPEVVKELLAVASDVNAATICGDTPLHLAAHWNETNMVKALLDMGADKNAENYLRETPLAVAKKCNNKLLLALLS